MIKHIIFDLGDVIVNVHPKRAMKIFAEKSYISTEKIQEFYLADLHLDFMRGRYSPEEFFDRMTDKFQFELDISTFFSIWNQVIGEPKKGIVAIIDQLADNFALSICSNTDQIHWNYCRQRFTFLQKFQHYFLSFEMKRDKPDPEVFNRVLSALKAAGAECVFIDDTLANVESARQFSIYGIHAREPAQIKQELQGLKLL